MEKDRHYWISVEYLGPAHGPPVINRSYECHLLHVRFFLGLVFDPEDGGGLFLRNIGRLSADCTALYP
jgi:hypothetical protein